MLHALKLLLPALIPSWRFFDVIAPSPRIEFTLLKTAQDISDNWQEFRPKPEHLKIRTMLKRMFWNSRWNESLFLVSCAERIVENSTDHSRQEILKRIKSDLKRNSINVVATPYLQFRLVFVSRNGAELERCVAFISPVYSYFEAEHS